ncbi:hypothetical protein KIN20_007314 [Parelaphostrongylus tenuis]|uniref:Uncharacterized protein n=1 Tax=Parelaphostrongylus tenuis TaxID=148309 RepID=A0AAD5QGS4_PARTN|nr:hypothetical protein KIN20_007314 [Parelaphostrongylus tenuis]
MWNTSRRASCVEDMRFNVTGFSLPVAMTYSTSPATQAQAPGISPKLGSAEGLVKRLVMQGVIEVLDQQGRAAILPDVIIATILGQLVPEVLMMRTCVIVGNTLTTTCPPAPTPPPGNH